MKKTLYPFLLTALLSMVACQRQTASLPSGEPSDSLTSDSCEVIDAADEEALSDSSLAVGRVNGVAGEGIRYVSDDGRLTIESGQYADPSLHYENWSVVKLKDDRGKVHYQVQEHGPYLSDIATIRKRDGSVYYLINNYYGASHSEATMWLEAYRIDGDSLRQVSMIDGSDDFKAEEQQNFKVHYNIPHWYFVTRGVGSKWLFEYDRHTHLLYIPQTDSEHQGHLTDRYHVWQFSGHRFEDKGIQAHKELYLSLRDYVSLACYFTTKDYIVRIDSLENGQLRYASWKKPKNMSDTPDLVLKNGVRHDLPCDSNRHDLPAEFVFTRDRKEYVVNHEEFTERTDSSAGCARTYLLVKEKGEVVLKQEFEREED